MKVLCSTVLFLQAKMEEFTEIKRTNKELKEFHSKMEKEFQCGICSELIVFVSMKEVIEAFWTQLTIFYCSLHRLFRLAVCIPFVNSVSINGRKLFKNKMN